MANVILDSTGKPLTRTQRVLGSDARARVAYHMGVRAGYDAAKTTDANKRHWTNADSLSADASATSSVRQILRNRARYEDANNSYCRGMVLTIANFCVGYGPRLRVELADAELNKAVQTIWEQWARRIRLAAKLRTMRMAQARDGESFALMTYNPRVKHPVQLDLAVIEADRVTEPAGVDSPTNIDGVILDERSNPTAYKVLKYHPGGTALIFGQTDTISADKMIHLYRQDRPEQHRGVTEIAPALPLFAQLRDYSWAVGEAAKLAAVESGWLSTDAPPLEDDTDAHALDEIEINTGSWNIAPRGYKPTFVKPEQPTTTHDAFTRTKLAEIARCLNMPYNIAAGNSGNSNMASARLDCQLFYCGLDTDRDEMELVACDRLLEAFLMEAEILNLLPRGVGSDIPHSWMWPPYPQPDPVADAQAFEIRRRNGADTLERYYAREGENAAENLNTWQAESKIVPVPGASATATAPGQTENPNQQEQPQ